MSNKYPKLVSMLFMLLCMAVSYPALAGKTVEVLSADPPSATPGATLNVTIGGKGFDRTATVRFLKKNTSVEGDITVGPVAISGSTAIIATITISDNAELDQGYDIEVSMSRGRGGKGTDLFRVQSQASGGHSTLSAKFCVTMTDLSPGLGQDGKGNYCDSKKNRILAFTGNGPGFRFDTNNSKQAPRRTVSVLFPGDGTVTVSDDFGGYLTTLPSMDYEIDLRFNKTYDGLDLGELSKNDGVGYVPIDVWFLSPEGTHSFAMSYGEDIDPLNDHGYLKGNLCVHNNTMDAKVTRNSDVQWTIESNPGDASACLWDMDSDLRVQEGKVVNMPFRFIITRID